jgi:hypothetical protein
LVLGAQVTGRTQGKKRVPQGHPPSPRCKPCLFLRGFQWSVVWGDPVGMLAAVTAVSYAGLTESLSVMCLPVRHWSPPAKRRWTPELLPCGMLASESADRVDLPPCPRSRWTRRVRAPATDSPASRAGFRSGLTGPGGTGWRSCCPQWRTLVQWSSGVPTPWPAFWAYCRLVSTASYVIGAVRPVCGSGESLGIWVSYVAPSS